MSANIDKVRDYLKCMRDCGVQVGLGTHYPEVIEYAEEKELGVRRPLAAIFKYIFSSVRTCEELVK